MMVKTYEADTIDQALSMVKKELGSQALILSTKNKKRKWYQKGLVEVTAASGPVEKTDLNPAFNEDDIKKIFPHRAELEAEESKEKNGREEKHEEVDTQDMGSIRRTSIGRYRDMLEKEQVKEAAPVIKPRSLDSHEYVGSLMKRGFSEETAKEVAGRLIFDFTKEERKRPRRLLELEAKLITGQIHTIPTQVFESRTSWAAVGVGGSGKTSMLVKMALELRRKGYGPTLVGCDQRKIVGKKEMAAYAKLISVPYLDKVVLERGLKKVMLIDTPAYSMNPQDDCSSDIGKICRGTNVFVVLDATWRLGEMLRVIQRVQVFSPVAVAFSRLDVASEKGAIFDVLKRTSLPLLGVSASCSFRVSFRFFDPAELAGYLVFPPDSPVSSLTLT